MLVNEFGEIGLDHALIRGVTDNVVCCCRTAACAAPFATTSCRPLREIRRRLAGRDGPGFRSCAHRDDRSRRAGALARFAPLAPGSRRHGVASDHRDRGRCDVCAEADRPKCHMPQSDRGRGPSDRVQAGLGERRRGRGSDDGAQAPQPLSDARHERGRHAELFCFGARRRGSKNPFSCATSLPITWPASRRSCCGRMARCPGPGSRSGLRRCSDAFGPDLLRLKGRLTFEDSPASLIIQAVHHTFYPVIEDPEGAPQDKPDFLVLILATAGPPLGLTDLIEEGGFAIGLDSWRPTQVLQRE